MRPLLIEIEIDKENTWVEEEVTDDGILLKICNKDVDTGGSSR